MISLPPVVRLYLYTAPCDMRHGFDRLKALAEAGVGVDPRHLSVYCRRRRDWLKILYWDRDGDGRCGPSGSRRARTLFRLGRRAAGRSLPASWGRFFRGWIWRASNGENGMSSRCNEVLERPVFIGF